MEALILTMLLKHAAPGAVPAPELAKEIMLISEQHKVSPVLVTQIIMTESRGRADAVNKVSHDYGLMQLNVHTMKAYKVSMSCALSWKCNLKAGILIVKDLKKHKRYTDCMYNLGPRKAFKLPKLCERYEQRLAYYE